MPADASPTPAPFAPGSPERSAIDESPSPVAVVGRDGVILAVNAAWIAFGAQNSRAVADDAGIPYPISAQPGLAAVVAGASSGWSAVYPCHSPNEERWFRMIAVPVPNRDCTLVIHRRLAEAPEATDMEAAANEHLLRMEGVATVCAWCGELERDLSGAWVARRARRTGRLSHGICPACALLMGNAAG